MPHAQQPLLSPTEKEERVLAEQKEKHIKRRSKILSDDEGFLPTAPVSPQASPLPSPGVTPSPRKNQNRNSYFGAEDDEFTGKAVKKNCSYVGSFTVAHLSPPSRAEFVRLQLQGLQMPKQSREVSLFISISGVKVCDPEDDGVVLMAHALKRISYATCDPDFKQFAFLARNPKGPVGIQYCHVFITQESYEVEEINAIVSKAFKVAYASIRSKRQFVRLVDELNREQEEYQSQVQRFIDAKADQRVTPEELADKQPLISPDRVRGVGVGQSRVWVGKFTYREESEDAKQVAGRVSHKQPHINNDKVVDSDPKEGPNHPIAYSANQAFTLSGETPPISQVRPSAPPLPVGEFQCQQEVLTKQIQKSKQLPPAPYYEHDVRNDWEDMGVIPLSGISVVAEAEGDQACHIRLQNEVLPPALAQSPTSPLPPPTNHVNGRQTGQILLQDSSVPPPFNYNPEPRSRRSSREELDNGDGYHFDYNMDDTVCLLNDGALEEDEDDEDFRYQMKIAEQFINATGDIESTDDELEYPWRRHMSSDEDDGENVQQDTTYFDDGLTEAERAEKEKRLMLLKANYAIPPPPVQAVFPSDRSEVIQGEEKTSPKGVPEQPQGEKENEGRPYQRLGYSPPKPVASPRQKTTRNSVIKDSEKSEIERSKRHKNSTENGDKTAKGEASGGKGLNNGRVERQVNNDRVDRGAHNNERSQRAEHRRTHLEVGERDISRSAEELSLRPKVDGDRDKCQSEGSASSLVSSDDKENYPNGYNERRKRAPGHINHKVEIEIGQFKVKKTATADRGSVPPLPPRSSSLNQKGPRNSDRDVKRSAESFTRAPWFKAGIPKDIAFEILRQQDKGAFIVRESKSHSGCYAISIKVDTSFNDSRIANYLVVRTKNGGYTIKGFGRDFPDLPRLVHYYSLHQEQLPCKLVFSGTNPLYKQGLKQGDDSDEDPDYKKLTDFSSMLL